MEASWAQQDTRRHSPLLSNWPSQGGSQGRVLDQVILAAFVSLATKDVSGAPQDSWGAVRPDAGLVTCHVVAQIAVEPPRRPCGGDSHPMPGMTSPGLTVDVGTQPSPGRP